jgi:hypothetical protein
LQQNRVGKEAHLDGSALHEQERDQRADHNRREERLQGNAQRHAERRQQSGPITDELSGDIARLRK